MAHILDNHLTEAQRAGRCKRMRSIVLLFAGIMACVTLIFRLLSFPYQEYFLIAGMIAITFQSHYCFCIRLYKNWGSLMRVILITLITAMVISYVLIPSLRLEISRMTL